MRPQPEDTAEDEDPGQNAFLPTEKEREARYASYIDHLDQVEA